MSITDGIRKKIFYWWQSHRYHLTLTTLVCYLHSQLKYKLKTAENDNIVCFFHPSPWAPGIRTIDPSLRALGLDSAPCVKWRWVSTTAIITVIFIPGSPVFSKSAFKKSSYIWSHQCGWACSRWEINITEFGMVSVESNIFLSCNLCVSVFLGKCVFSQEYIHHLIFSNVSPLLKKIKVCVNSVMFVYERQYYYYGFINHLMLGCLIESERNGGNKTRFLLSRS